MARSTQVRLDRAPEDIVTTRLLDAPRDLVWRAFTDPTQISAWWGPRGFRTTTQAHDLRVGGRWTHTMRGPDGTDYPNYLVYTRVEPPALLAWDHGTAPGAEPLFRCLVTFEAVGAAGERTLLTLRHRFPSAAARDENIRRVGSVQGAIDTMERLASHLVALPDERDFVLVREFEVPRALLWRAWTEAEHFARWWGPAAFENTVCEIDARVGGRWRVTMSGPFPGPELSHYPIEGEVLEIVAPERLVLTLDCRGHPKWWHAQLAPARAGDALADPANPAGTMVLMAVFEALTDARMRLTIRERMVSASMLAAMRAMGMEQGWSESLDRLADEARRMGG